MHVKHVFADEAEILVASSWEELDSLIRRKPVDTVILDPAADGLMNVGAVAGIITRYPSLPLIAYVTLGAPAFNAVSQLSRLGIEDVVLHRFDDAPDRFRERVERVRGNPLTRHVIEALAPSLGQLPVRLASAVENMFEQPHRYSTALDLSMGSGVPIVRLYRNIHAANLGSPKKLLVAAKLLRGYTYLRDPGYTVLDVSVKLGYRAARIFSQHAFGVFGLTPSRMRTHLAEADAIRNILEWLRSTVLDGAAR